MIWGYHYFRKPLYRSSMVLDDCKIESLLHLGTLIESPVAGATFSSKLATFFISMHKSSHHTVVQNGRCITTSSHHLPWPTRISSAWCVGRCINSSWHRHDDWNKDCKTNPSSEQHYWLMRISTLVGGFNPFETYISQIGSFPQVWGGTISETITT